MVAGVAVQEADLEHHALDDLGLEPVGPGHPEPLGGEAQGVVERGRGHDGVAEALAGGDEPAGHERAVGRRRRALEAEHDLDGRSPGAPTEASRATRRVLAASGVLGGPEAGGEPLDGRLEGRRVGGLEAEGREVVARSRADQHPVDRGVVRPGAGAVGGGLAGCEAHHVGEQGAVPDVPEPFLNYILTGAGPTIFVLAPECRRLAGFDPLAPEAVETHADAVIELLFGRRGRR